MAAHLHLAFPEHLIQEPVLYRLGRDFEVVPNITRANVDERFAWVTLRLEGEDEAVERAVAWLREQGIEVNELEDG